MQELKVDLCTKITIQVTVFAHVFPFTEELYNTASCSCLVCFHFKLQDSINISHRAGLLVMNSLNICLYGKVLISPSFLKDNSADTVS